MTSSAPETLPRPAVAEFTCCLVTDSVVTARLSTKALIGGWWRAPVLVLGPRHCGSAEFTIMFALTSLTLRLTGVVWTSLCGTELHLSARSSQIATRSTLLMSWVPAPVRQCSPCWRGSRSAFLQRDGFCCGRCGPLPRAQSMWRRKKRQQELASLQDRRSFPRQVSGVSYCHVNMYSGSVSEEGGLDW